MEITSRDGQGKALELSRIGLCAECRKPLRAPESQGVAYIMLGTVYDLDGPAPDLGSNAPQAFLHVGLHGNQCVGVFGADLEIIARPGEDQMDLSFCNTACLRNFFERIVDNIESETERTKRA